MKFQSNATPMYKYENTLNGCRNIGASDCLRICCFQLGVFRSLRRGGESRSRGRHTFAPVQRDHSAQGIWRSRLGNDCYPEVHWQTFSSMTPSINGLLEKIANFRPAADYTVELIRVKSTVELESSFSVLIELYNFFPLSDLEKW